MHPELAVQLALVNMLHCTFIGQFDEALAHREWARSLEAKADGIGDWIVTLDTLAMYCHTYVGQFSPARQLAETLTAAQVSAASASTSTATISTSTRYGPQPCSLWNGATWPPPPSP